MERFIIGAEVKSLEEGVFEVIASTGAIDRLGDKINPEGWYLNNYKRNPVMLWAHDASSPAVAKATKVWIEDKKLKAKGTFAPTPFAQELKVLVEQGFQNAVSVGFFPLVEDEKGNIEMEEKSYRRANEKEIKEFEKGIYENDGIKFDKQELLEISWVNVPALPQALVTARKENLPLMIKMLEGKAIEKEGRVISTRNRSLIHNCISQMGEAIDALKELLEATEPAKDIAPTETKGRTFPKAKESPQAKLMLLKKTSVALDNLLRSVKKSSSDKTELTLLRIADKVIEVTLKRAKANK